MQFLYVIEFPNGKRYFGITVRAPDLRWKDHLKVARKERRRPVCQALRKYPTACMRVLLIGPADYVRDLESKMIAAYNSTNRLFGYNFGRGGDHSPMTGKRHTAEAIAKISAAGRGRIRTPESKAKTSAALKGRPISPARRAKISSATKLAMARPEVKAKIRVSGDAKIGQSIHANLRASITGKPLSKAHRAKLSVSLKGRTFSEETRVKMSQGKTLSWARKKAAQAAVKGFS